MAIFVNAAISYPNSATHPGKMLQAWNRLPTIIRSVITGFLVAAAGTLPWAAVVALNVKYWSAVPWSIIPAIPLLWLWWQWANGRWWPKSTSQTRRNLLRANSLAADVWSAAMLAGIAATIAFIVFLSLLARLVHLPAQHYLSEVKHMPVIPLFLLSVWGSIVAGVTEEGSFRGYMQGPIEKRHGPVIAILVTGILFGFAHSTHNYFALSLLPFYLFIATMYGALAWITNSILPSLVLHTVLDIIGAAQLLATGRAEWQSSTTPKRLIWQSAPDAGFWMSLIGTLVMVGASIWAYRALYDLVRLGRTTSG